MQHDATLRWIWLSNVAGRSWEVSSILRPSLSSVAALNDLLPWHLYLMNPFPAFLEAADLETVECQIQEANSAGFIEAY